MGGIDDARTEEAGPSTCQYVVGHRYLHAKTRYPLTVPYVGPLPPPPPSSSPTSSISAAANGDVEASAPASTSAITAASGGNEQIWLGVEYDNPSHGKGHDGLYKDMRVFQAAQKGSAAFLKLSGQPLLEGSALIESIEERYGSILPHAPSDNSLSAQEPEQVQAPAPSVSHPSSENVGPRTKLRSNSVEADEQIVLGSSNANIIVQAPNISTVKQRMARLEKIRNMGFEEEWIASLGRGRGGDHEVGLRDELKKRMGGLKWLNLSRNLIPTWDHVAEIVDCFTGLEALTLNRSRLAKLPSDDSGCEQQEKKLRGSFAKIKELHLSDCLLSWDEICHIVKLFPDLEILHLEANSSLDRLTRPLGKLDKLKELRLGGCPISTWEGAISSLVDLPSLENLDLSFTNIARIEPSDQQLGNLKSVTMLSASLRSWTDLDHLSTQFPNLASLRFSLSESYLPAGELTRDEKDLRSVCIAKFPHIATFNSTVITPSERRDAEVFYVGYVRKQVAAAQEQAQAQAQAKSHEKQQEVVVPATTNESGWGRWDELSKKHGLSSAGPTKSVKTGLKGKMINLTLHAPEQPDTLIISILPSSPISLLHRKVTRALDGTAHKRRSGDMTSHTLWTVVYPDPPGSSGEPEKAVRVSSQDDTGSYFKTKRRIHPPARDVGWWFVDGDGIWAEPDPPDSD
ncbi:hypothetical protein IAU59_003619 [Kwoniella sp. CBS 9459]